MFRATVSLLALLLLPAAALGAGHPDVGAAIDPDACLSCHGEATPQIVKDWEGGKHGLILVKCFVCHGSNGKDFTKRPVTERCNGCHADKVASVTPKKGKPQSCFACHAPHTLAAKDGAKSPHSL